MLTVHHLNHSRSHRILWLLEELNHSYELKTYARAHDLTAPPDLRKVHPLGKSPILVNGATVVAESAVILEYLVDTYGEGRLRPDASSEDFARYRYFMHYAEGSVMTPILFKLVFDSIPRQKMPIFVKHIAVAISAKALTSFIDPQLKIHLDFIEGELATRPYVAGREFSAADVQMSFPLEAARSRVGDFARAYPVIDEYVDRLRARPAYRRAEARGGPAIL